MIEISKYQALVIVGGYKGRLSIDFYFCGFLQFFHGFEVSFVCC